MAPALHALADGRENSVPHLREAIASQFRLTEEDLKATIPSCGLLFANRLHWAITYLYCAGLVARPRRGGMQITQRGREVLAKHPDRVDVGVLSQFEEFIEFRTPSRRGSQPESSGPDITGTTPRETVSAAVEEASVSGAPCLGCADRDGLWRCRGSCRAPGALGRPGLGRRHPPRCAWP